MSIACVKKQLIITYKNGKVTILTLKDNADIDPFILHRMARPGALSIVFHMGGRYVVKGRDVASINYTESSEPWDYDDPLN